MVTFNLLDWRNRAHAYELGLLKKMLISAIGLAITIAFLIHTWIHAQMDARTQHVIELKQQWHNTKASSQTNVDNAKTLALIQTLRKKQYDLQQLFIKLSQSQHVCFKELHLDEQQLTLIGLTSSMYELTTFIHDWNANGLFKGKFLQSIQQTEKDKMQFRLGNLEKNISLEHAE